MADIARALWHFRPLHRHVVIKWEVREQKSDQSLNAIALID